jgi:hypothetical protein
MMTLATRSLFRPARCSRVFQGTSTLQLRECVEVQDCDSRRWRRCLLAPCLSLRRSSSLAAGHASERTVHGVECVQPSFRRYESVLCRYGTDHHQNAFHLGLGIIATI